MSQTEVNYGFSYFRYGETPDSNGTGDVSVVYTGDGPTVNEQVGHRKGVVGAGPVGT